MNPRERALAAWRRDPVDRPSVQPILMSFSARHGAIPFERFARDHRALVECQISVAEAFGIDVVSVTSDPCRECHDVGGGIVWFEDEPPMPDPNRPALARREDLARIKAPAPDDGPRMSECLRGVRLLRERVGEERAVQGWVEGPMAQGCNLRGLNAMMEDVVDAPEFVRDLFTWIVDLEIAYLRAQVRAGADVIGIGDAAASLVGPQLYEELIWPYEKRLVDAAHEVGAQVRLHICGRIEHLLPGIARLEVDMVDVDALTSLEAARALMPDMPLLGNADPVRDIRCGTAESIRAKVVACQAVCGHAFIVGAGCELPPDTPAANVLALTTALA